MRQKLIDKETVNKIAADMNLSPDDVDLAFCATLLWLKCKEEISKRVQKKQTKTEGDTLKIHVSDTIKAVDKVGGG